MKNILFAFIMCCMSITLVNAQAYEGSIEYKKAKQEAFAAEYNFSADAVDKAITHVLEKNGGKITEEKGIFNKDKGFKIFKNTSLTDIAPGRFDYAFKVDKKSSKKEETAVLYMLVLNGDANVRSQLSADEVFRAKSFLNNLIPEIEAANLELQITAQEDVVVKTEKKLKGLEDDVKDMEKKIKKLEEDIVKNQKDQEKTKADIENQRKLLDEMKNKRKVQ